jgi:hypothetical protein
VPGVAIPGGDVVVAGGAGPGVAVAFGVAVMAVIDAAAGEDGDDGVVASGVTVGGVLEQPASAVASASTSGTRCI